MLLLPDCLQRRACGQRLDALRQATARLRPVLAEDRETVQRNGSKGEGVLHTDALYALRRCEVHDALQADAIYRREDGMVVIDPAKCTGCKLCPDACPSESIYFNEGLNIAQKCTGCSHLLDDGWDVPRCVDACPTEALRFGEESELKELIARAEPTIPDAVPDGCSTCICPRSLSQEPSTTPLRKKS